MKFQIGDKIRFRFTGGRGEIVKDFLDGSYMVYDPDDREEMVAFADDIVLESQFMGVEKSELAANKKQKPAKKERQLSTEELFFGKDEAERRRREELAAALPKKNTQNPIPATKLAEKTPEKEPDYTPDFLSQKLEIRQQPPSDKGLYLGLAPELQQGYVVYLINDTPNSFSFDFELVVQQNSLQQLRHSITPYEFFAIGEVSVADMLESPALRLALPAISFEKTLRIKAKKLMESNKTAPLMGCNLYLFPIFEGKNPPLESSDLKNYTQKLVQKNKPKPSEERLNEVESLAHFEWELDLHFDKLVENPAKYKPHEILPLQMDKAQRFVERAESTGVPEIYIIHGVGNGRLREQLHQFLKKRPTVEVYKNEWHKKYGNGATYVKFRY